MNVRFARLAAAAVVVGLVLLLGVFHAAPASAGTWNVRSFGARGGGADDSAAFNRAIVYAHMHGGGVVYVPRG
ncbi:MAG: glycosyl hydrolase family 28-related protein, partial [Gaiellales bacterium]